MIRNEDPMMRNEFPRQKPLSEKEVAILKDWNSCMSKNLVNSGFLAVFGGLCFKVFSAYRRNPPKPIEFSKKDLLIALGNFGLASFLGTPLCYLSLKKKHGKDIETILEERQRQSLMPYEEAAVPEESTHTGSMDYHSNLGETSDSTFSHLHLDLESSYGEGFVEEDLSSEEKSKTKIPTTTYDDLRKRNRENYAKTYVANLTQSPYGSSSSQPPKPVSPPEERFPGEFGRKVIKNKYGDEFDA